MSLNKKQMVREVGRRTHLKNGDVQAVIETLIEVWTEALVNGTRIELENFFVLESQSRQREKHVKNHFRVVKLRTSQKLKSKLNCHK